MEKKLKHKKKTRHPRISRVGLSTKKAKSDNLLTKKSDEDGVLIFQYDVLKPQWIFKKIKSHFAKRIDEECKAWGLKV